MSEDRPSSAAEPKPQRSWLERLGQVLQSEPKDRDDLIDTLRDAHRRGLIDNDAFAMIDGVLSVGELQVRDIMIPRSQMVVVKRDDRLEDFLPMMIESAHSRFPVIGETRDEVVGVLLAKDMLPFIVNGPGGFNIREHLRPALFIPESKRLNVLLKEFRTNRNHMAIVVDEYGGVAGLVTIEDVIEQIVGDIADEHDVDEAENFIVDIGERHWKVRALAPIEDFNEHCHTAFSDDEFDTVGGLVLGAFGRMPKRGEYVEMAGLRFAVVRADNRRIYLLDVTPAEAGPAEDSGQTPSA